MRNTCCYHVSSLVCCVSIDTANKNSVLKRCKMILNSKIEITRISASVNVFRLHGHLRYSNIELSSPLTRLLALFMDWGYAGSRKRYISNKLTYWKDHFFLLFSTYCYHYYFMFHSSTRYGVSNKKKKKGNEEKDSRLNWVIVEKPQCLFIMSFNWLNLCLRSNICASLFVILT